MGILWGFRLSWPELPACIPSIQAFMPTFETGLSRPAVFCSAAVHQSEQRTCHKRPVFFLKNISLISASLCLFPWPLGVARQGMGKIALSMEEKGKIFPSSETGGGEGAG
jgi:hypothetical protein